MNKLSSALLTLCLVGAGGLALADAPKAMDSMEKHSMSKDAMDKGSMDKSAMDKGTMTKKKDAKPKPDGKMEPGGSMSMERSK